MKDTSERIIGFDLLRVVSICYIISVWHLDDYLKPINLFKTPLTSTLTLCALNIFIYISGFLLFRKYGSVATIKDAKRFLAKRLIRLYPLYVSALLLFYLTSIYDYKDLLCALIFCNIIITINIKTLWFVSLILVYYMLIPIISYKYSAMKTLLLAVVMIVIGITLHEHYRIAGRALIESRLILFFPSFILGILSAKHKAIYEIMKNKIIVCIALAFLLAAVFEIRLLEIPWRRYLNFTVYMSIAPLIVMSEYLAPKFNQRMLINLSYATFCMYLYHRIFYWLLLEIYYPQTNLSIILYLICVGLPIIYVTSKYIQGKYDYYLHKYFSSII